MSVKFRKLDIMGTAELKSSLHSLIDHTSNNALLQAIYTLLSNADSSSDWWDDISDEEKKSIEKGIDDYKNGRVVSHEEVMKGARDRINAFKRKNG